MMNVRQLRYFVSIVEEKSFGRAAAQLRIAQPALSHQVRKLEEELGVSLLVRHARGVVPTEAGQTLLDHARVILRQMELARHDTMERAGRVSGHVALGLTPSICLAFGGRIVEYFLRNFPDVSLNVREGFTAYLGDWLMHGTIDVAVIYNPSPMRLIETERLVDENLVLVGRANDPRLPAGLPDLESMADLPLILPMRPNIIRQMIDSASNRRQTSFNVILEIDTLPTIKDLVMRGIGYTILPLIAVHTEIQAGILRACYFADPEMTRTLVLAWPTARPMTRATREISSSIRPLLERLYAESGVGARPQVAANQVSRSRR